MKVDYLEDSDGNLTKVLMSDKKFETLHMTGSNDEKKIYCLVLTEEMEGLIKQHA